MKIAICLHVYYENQVSIVISYLANLNGVDYDLYVTGSNLSEETITQLKSFNPETIFIDTPNRGYDIGPFIEFLHHIDFDKYDYVMKLHTKGTHSNNHTLLNNKRMDNALWGKILWNSMLENANLVYKNLTILEQNPKIGMIGSQYCLTSHPRDYEKFLDKINQILQEMDFPTQDKISFIAGSMFVVRAHLLKPLLKFDITDFAPTNRDIKEGTLAHTLERLFGAIVAAQGYKIKGFARSWYGIKFFISSLIISLKRFFFQKKITNSGKQLIKICKIPVYSRELNKALANR